MYTKHPSIHDSSKREIVKHLTAPPPHVTTSILALTFVVKAVYLCDLAGLVVSAYKCHAFRIPHFESEQQEEGLDAVESSINKVTCKYRA